MCVPKKLITHSQHYRLEVLLEHRRVRAPANVRRRPEQHPQRQRRRKLLASKRKQISTYRLVFSEEVTQMQTITVVSQNVTRYRYNY